MAKRNYVFQILWTLISVLIYVSVLVSPKYLSFIGLVAFAIPMVIVLNIIVFIFSILMKSTMLWFSGFCLLLSIPFWNPAVQWNGDENMDQDGLKLLSYNVQWFRNSRDEKYIDVLEWINAQDADIICFQEFYPLRNIAPRLTQDGKYEVATDKDRFSVSIYSKFPIIEQGSLFDTTQLNNIRYADINFKGDTLRVYNIHLQSMGLNTNKGGTMEDIENNMKPNLKKFVNSHARRVEQMQVLKKHIQACPFPVLLAGDFNDIPYSFNYFQMNTILKNAFEEKGNGFGFTFNDGVPFLRIDNAFVSEHWQVKAFKTFNKVKYSDHYPIMGIFELSR